MAISHVQYLGDVSGGGTAHTTTVIAPSSKTLTLGDTIIVGVAFYFASKAVTGIADNRGNVYSKIEAVQSANNANVELWYAPVTVAGTVTAITITHNSTSYTNGLAMEFSGVGTLQGVGGGLTGPGTTATWMNAKTIPAGGLAVGIVKVSNLVALSAGAASGSPSTTIVESGECVDPNGQEASLDFAIAGASAVTSFSGTTTLATSLLYWGGAGGLFNPSAVTAVSPNFLPFFWA